VEETLLHALLNCPKHMDARADCEHMDMTYPTLLLFALLLNITPQLHPTYERLRAEAAKSITTLDSCSNISRQTINKLVRAARWDDLDARTNP
jgi:hypothetical protein